MLTSIHNKETTLAFYHINSYRINPIKRHLFLLPRIAAGLQLGTHSASETNDLLILLLVHHKES